jgi:hypothetical protein
MKLLTGCLVLVLLGATTGADAWSWPWSRNRNPRLPKPIDSPIVRPKLKAEKATRQKHPSRYLKQEWGQEWEKTLSVKSPHEGNHSIFRD